MVIFGSKLKDRSKSVLRVGHACAFIAVLNMTANQHKALSLAGHTGVIIS